MSDIFVYKMHATFGKPNFIVVYVCVCVCVLTDNGAIKTVIIHIHMPHNDNGLIFSFLFYTQC